MEFKINLSQDIAKAMDAAEADLKLRVKVLAKDYVATMLHGPGGWGRPTGPVYDIIKHRVDNYVTSSQFDAYLDAAIEEMVREECRGAVRTLLNSRIRKQLFVATNPNPSDA